MARNALLVCSSALVLVAAYLLHVKRRKPRGGKARIPNRLKSSGGSLVNVIESVDCHCGGLPARVIVNGAPVFESVESCQELRRRMMEEHDWFRKLLLQEPRGYPCQNVDIIFNKTPLHPEAAYSFVIGENNGIYPNMSGHNTICVCTALLETGMIKMEEPVTKFALEAPAGLIEVEARCRNGKAESITFVNVPSFVFHLDVHVCVPHVGNVLVDIAYGGMIYAIVDLRREENAHIEPLQAIRSLLPQDGGEIVRLGEMIKVATREQFPTIHPQVEYTGPDIMAFRTHASAEGVAKHGCNSRNAVVMSTGELDWNLPSTWKGNIDRSPCGTGTCAIMATMVARGQLHVGDAFVHESVLGSVFVGKVLEQTFVDGIPAIIPSISGSAWITQVSKVVVDRTDPFPNGFTVGDIWA